MNLRSKRLTAILLSASLVFSMNAFAFAEEVEDTGVEAGIDSVVDAVGEEEEPLTGEEFEADNDFAAIDEIGGIDGVDAVDAENSGKAKDIPNALSGNVTIKLGTPYINVKPDFTASVNDIRKAVTEQLSFIVGTNVYNVSEREGIRPEYVYYPDKLYLGKPDKGVYIGSNMSDYIVLSLNKIRNAGARVADGVDLKYKDNGETVTDVKGNQIVTFKATIDTSSNRAPHAKANTVEGEILLKTPYSGTVSEQRVTFGNGKYALVVTYDAAVEYRGTKVGAVSHYFVASENDAERAKMGEVDGAVGVGARLEVLSDNKIWYDIDKDDKLPNGYYWKDDNGITLSKPKIYNGKKVGSMYDETGPYFTIKMSYKKKQGENELLTQDEKLQLKNALKSARFHFSIEPKRISSELITYSKFVPDRFYIKKLTYNSGRNTLAGAVQYRTQKKNSKTLNARSMKNTGKKLKIVSKTSHDSNPKAKTDAYFVYDSNQRAVVLTGVNGYYGSAVISDKVTIK